MSNGLSRLADALPRRAGHASALPLGATLRRARTRSTPGLVTFAPDDIDWEDEVRLAIEERASALARRADRHGGEPALRRPETMETKIFGRLSAWQNWIFQRPNAVGEQGALTLYGKPERARFDWTRT